MGVELGILFAFAAMLCWGFGDFLIQKSVRKLGDWETLFIITLFGTILLLPFVYQDIPRIFSLQSKELPILLGASAILFFAALLDFEALKRGKLSVVEPLWSIEVPVSTTLAFLIIHESMSPLQGILVASLVVGLFIVSLHSQHLEKRIWLEKGVALAFLAAIVMGAANFFVGWGARASDALMMNWFLNLFIALASFPFVVHSHTLSRVWKDAIDKKTLWMCLLDNSAWIAFAFAMTLAPIAIAVAISESYIIVAVLLGLYINKEKLRTHQKVGLVIAMISAVWLAAIIT